MSNKRAGNVAVRVVTVILLLVLVAGAAGAILNLLLSSIGVYVEYGGNIITSDNDGISINCTENDTAVFTIKSSDWGAYSVENCVVTVINNIDSSSAYDFEYSAGGKSYLYSAATDFTSMFSEDGGGITVNSDGGFTLYLRYPDMQLLLDTYTGSAVTIDGSPDVGAYPYFAVKIVPPDNGTAIVIPFTMTLDGIKIILPFESIVF